MGSDILKYYQGKGWNDDPGRATKLYFKTTHQETSEKQIEYHKALIAFLKSKGYDPRIFDRPKDKRDCRGKIGAMITVMRKHGWDEEFFGKPQERSNDAQSKTC